MDRIELRRECRRQAASGRLGSNHPSCVCGESDWRCLQLKPRRLNDVEGDPTVICRNCRHKQRRIPKSPRIKPKKGFCVVCIEDDLRCLELHHIAGRTFADDVVVVCCNCHGKLSDMQKDHPQ